MKLSKYVKLKEYLREKINQLLKDFNKSMFAE